MQSSLSEQTGYHGLFAQHIDHLTEHAAGELRGLCPFHDDQIPSWTGSRRTGLWRCFGCGAQGNAAQFAERLGERGGEQRVNEGSTQRSARSIVAVYPYYDEQKNLLYEVVRFEPKDFRQRRPDLNGEWCWNLNGTRRVLYRLPQLPLADTVFLVEGEKDVDRLWSLGLFATTNPQGAGKWRVEYRQALAGKRVVILPDNDEPGEQHALQVARSLLPVAVAVKIVRLPGLPPKGDVSDWLNAGHTKDELAAIVQATPIFKAEDHASSEPTQESKAILTRLSEVSAQPVRWLWRSRISLGKVTVLDGDPGLGKSLLSTDIAARVTSTGQMPDGTESDLREPAGVVILSAEDDLADTIRPRLEAADADPSRIVALTAVNTGDDTRLPVLSDLEELKEAIRQVNARLVIIDPLMAYLPGKVDSHRDQDIRRSLAPLAALAAETGVAVLVIRHLNKAEGRNALYRGGGSIGIIGAARSGLLVAKDPEDEERRILVVTKSNLAKLPPALAYRIVENAHEIPSLSWEGVTNHTAASLLAQPVDGEDRSTLEEAKVFLCDMLASGAVPAKEVQQQADRAGISSATLRRAKTALKVITRKQGGFFSKDKESQQWCWMLSAEDALDPPEDAQTQENEHLQQSGEKNTRKSVTTQPLSAIKQIDWTKKNLVISRHDDP